MDKPIIVEISDADVEALLEAGDRFLPPKQATHMHAIVQAYRTMTDKIGEQGATIAELRRALGLKFRNSEKTKAVLCGHDNGAKGAGTQASKPAGAGAAPEPNSSPNVTAPSPSSPGTTPTTTPTPAPSAEAQSTDSTPAPLAEAPSAGSTPSPQGDPEPSTNKKGKGHGRLAWEQYPHGECIRVIHDNLRPGQTCPLCHQGSLYKIRPSIIVRLFGQPPLVARCWVCGQLRCSTCGHVFTARPPADAKGQKCHETAIAMIILQRYGNSFPHHRQARLQKDCETPVPASTQWDFVRRAADEIKPLWEELRRQAAQAKTFYIDDSYVRILALMGKRLAKLLTEGKVPNPERTGLFTTGIVAVTEEDDKDEAGKAETGEADKGKEDKGVQIALFISGRKYAGENLADLLKLRDKSLSPPLLMSDALNRNVPKGHEVVEANCLAHGRRHVVDLVEKFPAECEYLLTRIGRIYRIDGLCAHFKLSADQRLRVHQRWSQPIMDELHSWMTDQFEQRRIEPNSGMGKAIKYFLKRWEKFAVFLRRPGAGLDNNTAERALKMAIQLRNNSLFYRTEKGAAVGDFFMSLIHTCRLNHVNPFEYLTAVLVHAKEVAANPAEWLPWTYRKTLARLDAEQPQPDPPPPPSPPPTRPPTDSAAPTKSTRPAPTATPKPARPAPPPPGLATAASSPTPPSPNAPQHARAPAPRPARRAPLPTPKPARPAANPPSRIGAGAPSKPMPLLTHGRLTLALRSARPSPTLPDPAGASHRPRSERAPPLVPTAWDPIQTTLLLWSGWRRRMRLRPKPRWWI